MQLKSWETVNGKTEFSITVVNGGKQAGSGMDCEPGDTAESELHRYGMSMAVHSLSPSLASPGLHMENGASAPSSLEL